MRLLIPSAGKRYLHIEYFKNATGVDRVVTTEINPMAPGIHAADACYQLPRSTTPDYIPAVRRLCEHERIDAIVPLMDLDIVAVNASRKLLADAGVQVLLSPTETIDLSMDKQLTYDLLAPVGLPIAPTFLASDWKKALADLGYPLVFKPRFANMKSSTRYVIGFADNDEELAELIEIARSDPAAYVLQRKYTSQEYQIEFFCDGDGTFVAGVAYKRLSALTKAFSKDGGAIDQAVTVNDPEMDALSRQLARSMRTFGPTMYQGYHDKDGKFYISEINPRLAGGSPLARAAGLDVFQWSVDLLRGCFKPVDVPFRELSMTSWVKPIFVENLPIIDKSLLERGRP